jgi:starch-binding outer membrane protein, SusD/RagB family
MKNIKIKLLGVSLLLLVMIFPSCTNDLNQVPDNGDAKSSDEFFKDPASYKQFLAKIYAGLAVTGQQGPAGSADIKGIDEGPSDYLRGYYYLQELTTDLAVIAWGDQTIQDFHSQTWTSLDTFLNATFARFSFQIVNCNEFLRQTSDEKLAERGVDAALKTEIGYYRAEARFMRALTYWHLLDAFGGGSLVTEDSPIDFYYPDYATRAELYNFVESELKTIIPLLKPAKTNEKYRADQSAAKMLLAKLYMNAKVYVNDNDGFNKAVPLLNEIIASGYTIHNPAGRNGYQELFLADNDKNGAQNEFIFAVGSDGLSTQGFGSTTFLTHAAVGGSMNKNNFGINGGWGGLRTTSAFVSMFPGTTPTANSTDTRGNFYKDGQKLEITDISVFTDGYAVQKFRNITTTGLTQLPQYQIDYEKYKIDKKYYDDHHKDDPTLVEPVEPTPPQAGSDNKGDFVDADFPLFRLADAYLLYAECAARGAAGANLGTAVTYVNALRNRAKTNTITQSELTLQFILDERARELHWECHRRTDLIRFGKFTGGSYIWPWKGGVASGAPTQSYRDIFPIPANALSANTKLIQNPGY